MLINFVLLKSTLLYNLITSITSLFGIVTLFLSFSLAISLGYQSFYVYGLYSLTIVIYFYLEYLDGKYTSLNEYISLLNRDNILKRVDGNLGYEFQATTFYGLQYFKNVTHPFSKFNKVLQIAAATASVIIIPMSQKEVYVDKTFDASAFTLLMGILFCINILVRHNFTNMIMIYRLKKALKNGELTVDQVLAVKKADGIPLF